MAQSVPSTTEEPGASRRWRRALYVLYISTAAMVTVQRGFIGSTHTTFRIFRESFWHLLGGLNLYAHYPAQQGGAPADLFKYSPTAALLYAPFALPPYAIALFAWSLFGAVLLHRAFERLLPRRQALLAALLAYPTLLVSMQACSSNAVVAALILLAYAFLEQGHRVRSAVAVALGAAMKIFPLAALTFALFHPRRRRFAIIFAGVAAIALLLPLLVTPPSALVDQYHWWAQVERSDAADLVFGLSTMHLLRGWIGGDWPNWPLQLAGTLLLIVPLALQRGSWEDARFRLHYLASLLAYAVLFNHQAEHASFIIGSAGVAIWCVTPPQGTRHPAARFMLGAFALVGLDTIPLLLVWIAMQAELYRWSPASHSLALAPEPVAMPEYADLLFLTGEHERPLPS